MKDNYTYPAILDFSDSGYINIEFIDFPGAMTCVSIDEQNEIEAAQDLLALFIRDYEEKGEEVPAPSNNISVLTEQQLVFINVWMPYHRSKIKEVYVKKTLTIPAWLDILAKANNINFSAVLVHGLKSALNLKP